MKNNRNSGFLQIITATVCGLLLLCGSLANAEIVVEKVEEIKKEEIDSMNFVHPPEGFYDDYTSVLKKYVDENGMVDYKGLQADRKELDDFLAKMADLQLEDYRKWYDKDKLTLWLNSYNAFVLQIVIDHYPIKPSILGSMMFPDNSIQQIPRHAEAFYLKIVNFSMTLNNMSNSVLKDQFQDPRMHMALASGSISSAPLLNVPYNGDLSDEQLKSQGERFFANEKNFKIDRKKKIVYFSKIFNWYAKEYTAKYKGTNIKGETDSWSKGILDYASQHLKKKEDIDFIEKEEFAIEFLDYDWSLNERAN